jgi:hypothetical protein
MVEIPAWEAGDLTLDCPRSLIVRLYSHGRRRLWVYRRVQARKVDVERLMQEARMPVSSPRAFSALNPPVSEAPSEQPLLSAPRAAETRAPKASRKVKEVAAVLRGKWPERPSLTVDEMETFVLTKIRPISKSTVERAIRWLEEQGWGQPRLD